MTVDTAMLVELTSDIVSAHVANNNVSVDKVAGVIGVVFAALQSLGGEQVVVPEKPTGAVSVRASVKPSHLVSMIDGKPYKMLKRHISLNGYTPETYRQAFDLPNDYPMVAADYAAKRSMLAKKNGLGRKPGEKRKVPK
jgi:predicted transcriptional regulator